MVARDEWVEKLKERASGDLAHRKKLGDKVSSTSCNSICQQSNYFFFKLNFKKSKIVWILILISSPCK